MPILTNQFRVYRVHSVTRPNVSGGLLEGFGSFSRQQLETFTAESLGFYIDEERHTEQFMLQASNSLDGPWEDIKSIVPLLGDPEDMFDDDDDDDRWGQCLRCKCNLTENEAALNDVCEGCRPAYFEEWQNEQDRLAEEAAEARRYPEEEY